MMKIFFFPINSILRSPSKTSPHFHQITLFWEEKDTWRDTQESIIGQALKTLSKSSKNICPFSSRSPSSENTRFLILLSPIFSSGGLVRFTGFGYYQDLKSKVECFIIKYGTLTWSDKDIRILGHLLIIQGAKL